ncbi:AMP-dependent synthetase/ligase [Lentzea sp. NBRC 102530]|uniref:AMP-dependent synthetase/ligase n=1 Tax=Lentzea sp. NBRC 102530 TaxID=3032201 RepID=UPI0024A16A5C|nr:AMP-dependent synthetase/ligase [Lentzea sp. NBRC 102530]GLY46558.1 AMP-dependent synthetase [Lentzea sp. NBRC 102530]
MALSIPGLLRDRAARTPDAEAVRYRGGGGWVSLTWAQLQDRVAAEAFGLVAAGLRKGDRVALMGRTSIEWIVTDLAVLAAGGATTTIYPNSTAGEVAHIVGDSGSRIVVVETDEHAASMPDGVEVLRFGAVPRGEGDYDALVDVLAPDDLATLIYTSGTTGTPKGVELTHENWLTTAEAIASLGILRPDDLHFLWLPLSHAFGKVLTMAMIAAGVPTAVDGGVERIVDNLGELRPSIVAAAPRIFEKIHGRIVAGAREKGGATEKIFRWADREHGPATRWLADRLVYRKLRDRVGGRIRYFVSGSAPLAPEIAEFFERAGITILEGYGLTESSAATFFNRPGMIKIGTVGPPIPGMDVKIADDGEVLLHGPGVMRGYHNRPDATAETLIDGWLHTGDIGELDEAGRLKITDRKKELIKTSGGKYVAPARIESMINAASPYISNVIVHGDRRKYCVALVTLDPDTASGLADAEEEVGNAIEAVNAQLARHETIKRFAVLEHDFSVEDGLLTASLKPRRREIEKRYEDVLDGLY